VMEQRGELLLLLQPCSFSYAIQRLGHAFPAQGPVRVVLAFQNSAPKYSFPERSLSVPEGFRAKPRKDKEMPRNR
jgi:hypothetical protein